MAFVQPSYPIQCSMCATVFSVPLTHEQHECCGGVWSARRHYVLRCPACRVKTNAVEVIPLSELTDTGLGEVVGESLGDST